MSYRGWLLISRNFGDSSEIVLVVSLDINCVCLITFINDNYCTASRSRFLLKTLLAVKKVVEFVGLLCFSVG